MIHSVRAVFLAFSLASLASAAELRGVVAIDGSRIRIGTYEVTASGEDARDLRELVGESVVVSGNWSKLGLGNVFRIAHLVDPVVVQTMGVVLRDHTRPGKHLLWSISHSNDERPPLRPEPGALLDFLVQRFEGKEVGYWAAIRRDTDGRHRQGRLLGVFARVASGRGVYIRSSQGDQVTVDPCDGAARTTVPLASLTASKEVGVRRSVRGVIRVDALRANPMHFRAREKLVLSSAGAIYRVEYDGLLLPDLPLHVGLEVELEGILTPAARPHPDEPPTATLLVERVLSPVPGTILHGTLQAGLVLRGGRTSARLVAAASLEGTEKEEATERAAERRASLIALLGTIPAGTPLVVEGLGVKDARGRYGELIVTSVRATDALGRSWWVTSRAENGELAARTGERGFAWMKASDLRFDRTPPRDGMSSALQPR